MKVEIDAHKCVGAGQCVMIAPDVFDQRDEDGVVFLLDEAPGEDQRERVSESVMACPAAAIRLVET